MKIFTIASGKRLDQHGRRIGLQDKYYLRKKKYRADEPYFLSGTSIHSPELCFTTDEATQVSGKQLLDMGYDWTMEWDAVSANTPSTLISK